MWRQTIKHDHNHKIWVEELDDFVPDQIVDFHIHIWNSGVCPQGTGLPIEGGSFLEKYDFQDLEQDLPELYPGRETAAVCFGLPMPGLDMDLNNTYIADNCDQQRLFGLRLFDPNEIDHARVKRQLSDGPFVGIKPYPDYVSKDDVANVEIPEMVPSWIMETIDDLGQIVMLHIPRNERLADPLNQKHLVELCLSYPNAKIILAHVGRAFYLKNIVGNLERLKDLSNLYFDVSMLNHWEVLEYLFKTFPTERILYGTDIPLALIGGKSIEINNQYTYATSRPWPISISDDHNKLVFTSFLYEELRALKHAVNRLKLSRTFVENLFHGNAVALLRSVDSKG